MPTFDRVRRLVMDKKVRPSLHSYAGFAKRGILFADVLSGVEDGIVIEDYPDYHIGPAVLVLQRDLEGRPLHVVWGIEKDTGEPAVVVTAYRPEPSEWGVDFRSRKP